MNSQNVRIVMVMYSDEHFPLAIFHNMLLEERKNSQAALRHFGHELQSINN